MKTIEQKDDGHTWIITINDGFNAYEYTFNAMTHYVCIEALAGLCQNRLEANLVSMKRVTQ